MFTQGKSTQLDVHKMCNYLILHVTRQQKIVVGLMDSTGLLDKGHHVYMDNYYTSTDLLRNYIFRILLHVVP